MIFLAKFIVTLPLLVFLVVGVLLAVFLGVIVAGLALIFQALSALSYRLSNT